MNNIDKSSAEASAKVCTDQAENLDQLEEPEVTLAEQDILSLVSNIYFSAALDNIEADYDGQLFTGMDFPVSEELQHLTKCLIP